jgi:hypothetical protein
LFQTTGLVKRTRETLLGMTDAFLQVEAHPCPMSTCTVPPGSPCRTGRGKVAAQYHTARFRLVPALAKTLAVPVPAIRKPGAAWTELPRPAAADAEPVGHVRIGYARASTARQSLDNKRLGRGIELAALAEQLRADGIALEFLTG